MPAAISYRRVLVATSVGSFALVFFVFLMFEKPGLGLANFFYVSIALLALATGPVVGATGGVLGAALFALAVALHSNVPPPETVTTSTMIRVVTYAGIGALVGWFAEHNTRLVEQLRVLAERDFLTGLPNTRAFEAAIQRRLDDGFPFALLLGDMDRLKAINGEHGHAEGNDALRRLADMLGASLCGEDEVARVGGDEFAVLTRANSAEEAARLAARLEATLAAQGLRISFGWSVHPHEGENALSLYRAADERLYARKLVSSPRDVLPLLRSIG